MCGCGLSDEGGLAPDEDGPAQDEDGLDDCLLPAFAEASITLDAQVGDWAEVAPFALDAQGDDSPQFTGDDLRAVYLAQSSEDLFVRVDLWEDVNTNFGNGLPTKNTADTTSCSIPWVPSPT